MTTYESYIQPDRLAPVVPLGSPDDVNEKFFIRTHQAFELWFAQILDELESARAKLAAYVQENDVPDITHHVRRAAAVFDLVRAHLPVLESLLTTNFLDFRRYLFGSGGVQSYRFREIEWLLGFRDPDLLAYLQERLRFESDAASGEAQPQSRAYQMYVSMRDYQARQDQWRKAPVAELAATHRALAERERDIAANGTLRQHVLEWLRRTPYPAPPGVASGLHSERRHSDEFTRRFRERLESVYDEDLQILKDKQMIDQAGAHEAKQAAIARLHWFFESPERRAIIFILQFDEQPLLAWPAELLEAVLELDEALLTWRDRHIAMVERVLGGGRFSTMGGRASGLPYLQSTLYKRAFPEIWDARTFLLGAKEGTDIYRSSATDWGEWRDYRLAHELRDQT
jgi:tryptophan 2,3-dioxygenase